MKQDNLWKQLRRYTDARIALGRAGGSLPTQALLDFQLAHARARDAVHHSVDFEDLAATITAGCGLEAIQLHSAAETREQYLLRPDFGRRLGEESRAQIPDTVSDQPDIALIIGDGLSGLAVEANAAAVVEALVPAFDSLGLSCSPVFLVANARVAIQDEIGEIAGARLALMLIGERPGLGVPDSLAAYFTWAPKVGRNDAERNCVSNIRVDGLPPVQAAQRICYLVRMAFERQLSGVQLKDDSTTELLGTSSEAGHNIESSS